MGDIDSLSQWRVDLSWITYYGPYHQYFKYYISGYTTVESNVYYRIYRSGYGTKYWTQEHYEIVHEYSGTLREEGNVWYSLSLAGDNEVVLYDFNMEIGDTVNSVLTFGETVTISDIDTVFIEDEPKRRYFLEENYAAQYILEDVGASSGLFEPLWSINPIGQLNCFAIDYSPVWINPNGLGNCNLDVGLNEKIITADISAYPNPFSSSTTVKFNLPKDYHIQFKVYNLHGAEVYQFEEQNMPPGPHSITPSLHHMPAGLYFGVLRSSDGINVIKMLKQ